MYHFIAFTGGFFLDLLLGDPYWLPHPIRAIGNLIDGLRRQLLEKREKSASEKRRAGRMLVLLVCGITTGLAALLLAGAYRLHPLLGCGAELLMTYQILACKCLKVESMKVYDRLQNGTLEEARYAVSMIVGRDTQKLTAEQVAKAAVETVAENTSDGVIAPMLYLALGGPVLGFCYKAINTMDSMVGYKNEKYLDFGRAAAKLDDAVNYIPARLSAVLMIAACSFLGKEYDGKRAWEIFLRDRYHHASPNSAQTEAVCAGALGIRLAGNAYYFGKLVEKPYIGDPIRPVETEDIPRANRLLYGTAFLCEGLLAAAMAGILFLI